MAGRTMVSALLLVPVLVGGGCGFFGGCGEKWVLAKREAVSALDFPGGCGECGFFLGEWFQRCRWCLFWLEVDANSLAAAEKSGFWRSVRRFRHWIFLSAAESVDFVWVGDFGADACFGGGGCGEMANGWGGAMSVDLVAWSVGACGGVG